VVNIWLLTHHFTKTKPVAEAVVVAPIPKPECHLSADGIHHFSKWRICSKTYKEDLSILQESNCDSCMLLRTRVIRPSNK